MNENAEVTTSTAENRKLIDRGRWLMAGFALLGIAVVFMAIYGIPAAKSYGEAKGTVSRERMELVWPNLMAMPVADRAVLAGLATTCNLSDKPEASLDADQVAACLIRGLAADEPVLPKGVDKEHAGATLFRLLEQSKDNGRTATT